MYKDMTTGVKIKYLLLLLQKELLVARNKDGQTATIDFSSWFKFCTGLNVQNQFHPTLVLCKEAVCVSVGV